MTKNDTTIEEERYMTELVKFAPDLLELLIEYVGRIRCPEAYKQTETSVAEFTFPAKYLCEHLLKFKNNTPGRNDKFQIGDIVEISKSSVQEAILVFGEVPGLVPIKATKLTVIFIYDEISSQLAKAMRHSQILCVEDEMGRTWEVSGYWFKPIIRSESYLEGDQLNTLSLGARS